MEELFKAFFLNWNCKKHWRNDN